MATSINDIYIGINYMLLSQRQLPEEIVITQSNGRFLTGIVVKTGVAPIYEVGCLVTYTVDNMTTVTINNIVYYIVPQYNVIFARHPESES